MTGAAKPFPALPRLDRVVILALAVALFLTLNGPLQAHLFDWDRTIGWSYAALPPLVLLALLIRRRFSWLAWLLHTLELLCFKFAITAGILLTLLVRAGPQAPASPPPAPHAPPPVAIALPPPPAARGGLSGRVAGAPDGTLVFVSAGLPDYAWPAPAATLELTDDGHGFAPALAAAQAGEAMVARSTDHHLHTLLMTQAGSAWRLNVPLLASGGPTPVRAGQTEGVVEVTCAVHPGERASRLVLLRHPFFQFARDGGFAFAGVPAGKVTLTALAPDGSRADAQVEVRAGQTARADWSLGPKP